MIAIVRSEKEITPSQRLAFGAAPAGRRGKSAGSHVLDRVDLKKAITLCHDCMPKFDIRRYGYTTKRNLPRVRGRCDGCQNHCEQGHLLVHRSLADNT
jgi:hypothetical protein